MMCSPSTCSIAGASTEMSAPKLWNHRVNDVFACSFSSGDSEVGGVGVWLMSMRRIRLLSSIHTLPFRSAAGGLVLKLIFVVCRSCRVSVPIVRVSWMLLSMAWRPSCRLQCVGVVSSSVSSSCGSGMKNMHDSPLKSVRCSFVVVNANQTSCSALVCSMNGERRNIVSSS